MPDPSADAAAVGPAVVPAPATPADAGAASHERKVLERLGVTIEVPAGCTVDDTSSAGRPPSYSLYDTAGFFSVMVREARPEEPKELGAAKKALPAATITREEEIAGGGWRLEWEAQRPGAPSRTDFGVDVLRTVGGRPVRCSRTLASEQAAAAVVKACLTLAAK
ncbi:MAG TPA: hypothetical protein VGK67_09195 [Myxococcales bacterium]